MIKVLRRTPPRLYNARCFRRIRARALRHTGVHLRAPYESAAAFDDIYIECWLNGHTDRLFLEERDELFSVYIAIGIFTLGIIT